jgi:hypothetical protein
VFKIDANTIIYKITYNMTYRIIDNNKYESPLLYYLKKYKMHKEDKKDIKASHTSLPGFIRPGAIIFLKLN